MRCPRVRLFLCLFALAAAPARAADLWVTVTGSDSAPGTSARPWRTLQHAADVVSPGDTVTARAGAYDGFQLLRSGEPTKPIRFRAAPGETVTVGSAHEGILIGENGNAPKTTVRYVEVSGFHMKGGADTWNGSLAANGTVGVVFWDNVIEGTRGNHALIAFNSRDFRIEGNTVRGAAITGIRAARSSHGVIRNNTVTGGGFDMVGDDGSGIYVNGSQSVVVEDNVCAGNKGNGILTELSDGLTIRGNECDSNGWAGIWIDSARGGLITQNTCRDNGGGVWASQTQGGVLSDVQIVSNVCDSNTRTPPHATHGGGIWIREGLRVSILHNVLYRNGSPDNPGSAGIFLGVYWGSSTEVVRDALVRGNLCVGNVGAQIRVMPNQTGRNNVADHNDFFSVGSVPPVIWGDDKFATVADWQKATGQGMGTLSADPRFADPDDAAWPKRDFRLRPDSPCHRVPVGTYGLENAPTARQKAPPLSRRG